MKSKSCALDPIFTDFLKSCLPDVISLSVDIVNGLLSVGFVPNSLKEAVVRPHLKKIGLDPESLNNYRPVSKVSERVVFSQLHEYHSNGKLYTKFQFAYRHYHSTETALHRVHNDVMVALHNGGHFSIVRPQCCFWHNWSLDTIEASELSIWHRWYYFEMVHIVSLWSESACQYWKFIIRVDRANLWRSAGQCTWPFTFYHVRCPPTGYNQKTWPRHDALCRRFTDISEG